VTVDVDVKVMTLVAFLVAVEVPHGSVFSRDDVAGISTVVVGDVLVTVVRSSTVMVDGSEEAVNCWFWQATAAGRAHSVPGSAGKEKPSCSKEMTHCPHLNPLMELTADTGTWHCV
jgi:hypothetical protein